MQASGCLSGIPTGFKSLDEVITGLKEKGDFRKDQAKEICEYFDCKLGGSKIPAERRIDIERSLRVKDAVDVLDTLEDAYYNKVKFVDDRIVSPSYCRTFGDIYDRVRLSPYVKWHHHNHPCKYAPAWKTLEFMTIGEILDLYDAISNVSSRLEISKAHGIRSISTFDNYLTAVRRVRNRCAHGGVLFDYAASEALTTKGPVDLSSVPDRTNLKGAIEVIKYLTGIVSVNRLADLEQELQQLIDRCKDNDALYTAVQVASGLK